MPSPPKTICPGCHRKIVPLNTRCESCQAKRTTATKQADAERPNFRQRGYGTAWTKMSVNYRKANPLCVLCLGYGRVVPCTITDHIVPVVCCPSQVLAWDNCQSTCNRCNVRKRFTDPKQQWEPNHNRVVVCGLPGTGRSTYAKSLCHPVFDPDDFPGATTIDAVRSARSVWVAALQADAPCVVVVGSTSVAPHVAYALRGVVVHLTERYVEKEASVLWHA